ncbi:MAG: sensor of ECF-type sigma factor [Algicola sp.]|nr:sensor of ECF-type sigma factor [Algicola sp.]
MKTFIPILFLLMSVSTLAQPRGKMNERIQAQKIAFITERLSLTPEEAQKFWPIYNAFEEKTEKIRTEDLRSIKKTMYQNPKLSEADANKLLNQLMTAENDMHNAKLQLVQDLKDVISSEKILRLKASEEAFNRKLLEKLRQFKEKRNN